MRVSLCNRMIMTFIVAVACFKSLTNKHGGKVCENEGLDKCYQDLNHVNENRKGKRNRDKANTCCLAHYTKNENQGNETYNYNVARYHVCKQTNHEGDWLNKYTRQLHRNENKLHG